MLNRVPKSKRMITGIVCLQILMIASGCFHPMTENQTHPTEQRSVLVLTGGHAFDEAQFYEMFNGFENTRIDHVSIKKECTYFDDIRQWDYDVIVFYNFRNTLSGKGQENLLQLCDKGTGLVILHHAIAGFPEWSLWPAIVGAQYFLDDTDIDGKTWKRSTYKHGVVFDVNVDKTHPLITAGPDHFEIHDETYKGFRLEPGNQILLTTDESLSQKEIGWTRTFGNANVCYIQLGHGKEAFGNPNYQQLLKNAVDWVTPE